MSDTPTLFIPVIDKHAEAVLSQIQIDGAERVEAALFSRPDGSWWLQLTAIYPSGNALVELSPVNQLAKDICLEGGRFNKVLFNDMEPENQKKFKGA